MSGRFRVLATLLSVFASVFALLHCGGTVEVVPGGSGGKSSSTGHAGHAGRLESGSGSGGDGAIPLDAAFDEYADPGCPDAGPPVEVSECDPFSLAPTCGFGEGCFPFVDHPYGEGCGAQSFGAQCARAGTGQQGDICSSGNSSCSSGFVCVVGSQPGKHCVKLCRMADPVCPPGMICGELDVEGYGVCS